MLYCFMNILNLTCLESNIHNQSSQKTRVSHRHIIPVCLPVFASCLRLSYNMQQSTGGEVLPPPVFLLLAVCNGTELPAIQYVQKDYNFHPKLQPYYSDVTSVQAKSVHSKNVQTAWAIDIQDSNLHAWVGKIKWKMHWRGLETYFFLNDIVGSFL